MNQQKLVDLPNEYAIALINRTQSVHPATIEGRNARTLLGGCRNQRATRS